MPLTNDSLTVVVIVVLSAAAADAAAGVNALGCLVINTGTLWLRPFTLSRVCCWCFWREKSVAVSWLQSRHHHLYLRLIVHSPDQVTVHFLLSVNQLLFEQIYTECVFFVVYVYQKLFIFAAVSCRHCTDIIHNDFCVLSVVVNSIPCWCGSSTDFSVTAFSWWRRHSLGWVHGGWVIWSLQSCWVYLIKT